MTGLIVLCLLVVVGIVLITSIGFVCLAIMTALFRLVSNSGPFVGRVARAGAVGIAACVMAIASVNMVSGHQTQDTPAILTAVGKTTSMPSTPDVAVDESTAKNTVQNVEAGSAALQPINVGAGLAEQPTVTTVVDIELPSWVTAGTVRQDDVNYILLESGLKASREDADAEVFAQAAKLIQADFTTHHAADVSWDVPRQVIEDAIRRTYYTTENVPLTETVDHDMHRAYAQVVVSPSLRNAIYPGWRKLIVTQRLVELGQGFGLVSLLVLSLATYLRYDKRTLGQKKGRMAMLSVTILAAGTVAVGAIGDSIRSRFSASNIIAEEYSRDRVDALAEPVIGVSDEPVISADDAPGKIAILIDNVGHLQRPAVLSREMSDAIGLLSENTSIEVHAVSSRRRSQVGFVGGQDATAAIDKLILRHKGRSSELASALQMVVSSGAEAVYVVTEGLTNLSDSDRETVLQIPLRVPVNFIKLSDDQPARFDNALRAFSTRTGGNLRFFDQAE